VNVALVLLGSHVVIHAAEDEADSTKKYTMLPPDAQAIFDKAELVELLSLDPDAEEEKPKEAFHDWKVLGKCLVKNGEERKALRAAIYKGVTENNGAAGCFHPRHGLRAVHAGKTVEMVICYECFWMQVYVGDNVQAVWTGNSPQRLLNRILRDAKVPLPKQAEARKAG
jgi:hypothetical protein